MLGYEAAITQDCDGDSDGDGNDLLYGVLDKKSVLELFQGALALFYGVTLFMGAYVLQVDTYLVL